MFPWDPDPLRVINKVIKVINQFALVINKDNRVGLPAERGHICKHGGRPVTLRSSCPRCGSVFALMGCKTLRPFLLFTAPVQHSGSMPAAAILRVVPGSTWAPKDDQSLLTTGLLLTAFLLLWRQLVSRVTPVIPQGFLCYC